jgi:ATP-dependent HslUV protease ATP-binding subunit HslU
MIEEKEINQKQNNHSLDAQTGDSSEPPELSSELLPPEVVDHLNRYIVAQENAKKAVALALRSRWRRLQVPEPLRQEITPKNILMIGPTGVGKTEIARRLAKLTKAPFVKVEASKFTEVGYIGRDVESIIRDLVDCSHSMVKEELRGKMREAAKNAVEEQLFKLLCRKKREVGQLHEDTAPTKETENDTSGLSIEVDPQLISLATDEISKVLTDELIKDQSLSNSNDSVGSISGKTNETPPPLSPELEDEIRNNLAAGLLEEDEIEIEVFRQVNTHVEIFGPPGFMEMEGQLKDMLSHAMTRGRDKKYMKVREARDVLLEESLDRLVEPDELKKLAIERAQESGIVFIDEIDKIAGGGTQTKGPDVSREGVQRDLLPLVEGSTVGTKYGQVTTDHILFIASGAFHFSKPSDLMPEFQGRFPIRVELENLTSEHFFRILHEPDNALPKQYQALLKTEGVELVFDNDGLKEIARIAAKVNQSIENIGARRLHTLLERILEDISFDAHTRRGSSVIIDKPYVENKLSALVKDDDISRFVL